MSFIIHILRPLSEPLALRRSLLPPPIDGSHNSAVFSAGACAAPPFVFCKGNAKDLPGGRTFNPMVKTNEVR